MINRTLLLQGPGFITYGAAYIHAETEIVATLIEEWSDSVSSGFGRTGRKLLDRRVEITATPTMWLNHAVLFPYASHQIGDPLFGAVDSPLVITPRNGRPLTILNVAITTLPNLKCSSADSLFKSGITWTGLCANNTSPGDLANFFTQGASATNVLQTGFDKTKVYKSRYTGTRNSVVLRSDKGFDIDFAMQAQAYRPDGETTAQYYLQSLEASAGCVPVALAESDYLALLNDGVDVGGEAPLHDLVVASEVVGHPTITLAKTMVEPGGFTYGGNPRNAALKFQTVREPATNVLPALWTIGIVPEPEEP